MIDENQVKLSCFSKSSSGDIYSYRLNQSRFDPGCLYTSTERAYTGSKRWPRDRRDADGV